MSRKNMRGYVLAVVVCGATASVAIGCGASTGRAAAPPSTSATETSGAEDEVGAGLLEHHRFHHHGGVTLFIAMSLDTLGVSAAQRATIEKIRADLDARMQPARAAEQSLSIALADGLAGASFDTAKIDAAVAQVTASAASLHEASADALNELHTALTPAERAALAEKVESHWAVWQRTNAEERGSPSDGEDGHLATLIADLGLTADQVEKIRAGAPSDRRPLPPLDPLETTTQVRAFSEAFRREIFDAHSLTAQGAVNGRLVGWGAAHMAHFVETLSPVLTPEQRAKLAQRLRDHSTHASSPMQRKS